MRPVTQTDLEAISELMIEAYRGTIDYDGETVAEAISEVQAYLDGQRGGKALLNASQLCLEENKLVAACLVGEWDERQQPLISYVMTHAEWKKQGYARQVLYATLQALLQQGYGDVRQLLLKEMYLQNQYCPDNWEHPQRDEQRGIELVKNRPSG